MGSAELSYLYGKLEYEYDITTDYDGTQLEDPEHIVNLTVGQYQDQNTHELQLLSTWEKDWNYVLGLYYFTDNNDQPYNINAPFNTTFATASADPLGATTWDNPLGVIYFQRGKVDNESWAVFGEVDFPLNDQWTVTAGLRYSEDDFDGSERQIRYYNLYPRVWWCRPALCSGCQPRTLRWRPRSLYHQQFRCELRGRIHKYHRKSHAKLSTRRCHPPVGNRLHRIQNGRGTTGSHGEVLC